MSPSRSGQTFAGRAGVAVVLVLSLVVGGFILLNLLLVVKLGKATRVDLAVAESPAGGGANYLLIGSDTRSFISDDPSDAQRFGEAGGQRSDTIMVLHTDPDSERSLLVSFPRDLWVNIPGRGDAKLNAAFNDGPQSVVDTLSSSFSVPIHHYVEVNFESFRQVVDAIGTIPVFFPAPARDEFSTLNIPFGGCVDLHGVDALAFVRSRNLELFNAATGEWEIADPIPDIGRIARQQALLRVLGEKAMDKALTNPFTANKIADAAIGQLTLDADFGRGDVFALADGFASTEEEPGPATLVIPTTPATRDGQSVLETTGDAESVLAQLRDFETVIRSDAGDATPSETRVRVLNASGVEGGAAEALGDLEGLGFVGAGTGNANERGVTEVRYASGQDDKAALVAAVISGDVEEIEDGSIEGADVVLVLGGSFEGIIRSTAVAAPEPEPGATLAPQPASLAPVPGDCGNTQ
ncbi:MAG: LCP family protein [Acidimicrobiia bacterium]